MKISSVRGGFAGVAALALLAACQETTQVDGTSAMKDLPKGTAILNQGKIVETERDVEAASVFSAQETGLWDGRPSFGGVWVAHPEATQPERVRITNVATGQSIAGALFRRERDFPGPRIQVSSSAAAALGILAGAPTELKVIALRRETVVIAPEPKAEDPAEAAEEATAQEETATEAVAAGEAEQDEAALTPAELRKKKREEAAAKRKAEREARLKAREEERARRKAEAEAKKAAAEQAKAEEAAAALAASQKADTKPLARPAQSDPVAAAADAAITEAETSAPAPAPAITAADSAKPPARPFAQVGIYQSREETLQISDALRAAGLRPTVVERKLFNQVSWRIIVGPAETQADYDATIAKLAELGYSGVKAVRR